MKLKYIASMTFICSLLAFPQQPIQAVEKDVTQQQVCTFEEYILSLIDDDDDDDLMLCQCILSNEEGYQWLVDSLDYIQLRKWLTLNEQYERSSEAKLHELLFIQQKICRLFSQDELDIQEILRLNRQVSVLHDALSDMHLSYFMGIAILLNSEQRSQFQRYAVSPQIIEGDNTFNFSLDARLLRNKFPESHGLSAVSLDSAKTADSERNNNVSGMKFQACRL